MQRPAIQQLAAARAAPRIAAGFFEKTVQLWDLSTFEMISEFETILDFGGRRLALSPDGELCVTAAWTKGQRGGVAGYSTRSGEKIWHRTDINHTQRIRFSTRGDSVFCGREEGRLYHLSARTGATLDQLAGVADIIESEFGSYWFWDTRTKLLKVVGPRDLRIPRLTFAVLDAGFSPDAVLLSESTGPVRCFDLNQRQERWRSSSVTDHAIRIHYHHADASFYGVVTGHGCRLVRWAASTGTDENVCGLDGSTWAYSPCTQTLISNAGTVLRITDGDALGRIPFPYWDK